MYGLEGTARHPSPIENMQATPEPPTKPTLQFMQTGAAAAAELLRMLSNEHRLLVLCLLLEHGELSVTAMLEEVELGQSALSQHLAKLRASGLVTYRRDAQTLYYRIQNPDVARLIAVLKDIYCP